MPSPSDAERKRLTALSAEKARQREINRNWNMQRAKKEQEDRARVEEEARANKAREEREKKEREEEVRRRKEHDDEDTGERNKHRPGNIPL